MPDNLFDETLAYFMELEDIERRQALSQSDMSANLLASAHRVADTRVEELCAKPEIRDILSASLLGVDSAVADLEFLKTSRSAADLQDEVDALDAEIQARQDEPTYRLARKYLGRVGLIDEMEGEQPEPGAAAEVALPELDAAIDFLSRPPEEVAADLEGKVISYGRSKLRIDEVRVQNPEDNAKYLKSNPVFGPDRRDAYVKSYRSASILFLRAGDADNTDCCVAIIGGTIRGKKLTKPTQVVRALSLPAGSVGNFVASEDGQQFKLADLEALKKKK